LKTILDLESYDLFTYGIMQYPVSWIALKTTSSSFDLYTEQQMKKRKTGIDGLQVASVIHSILK